MRNIPIISKFLVILLAFGLFVAGVIAYSSSRLSFVNTNYMAMLQQESTATLTLARTSRSLVSARAGIADLLLARTPEAKKVALADIEMSKGFVIQQLDLSMAALPGHAAFAGLKADSLNSLDTVCGPLIAAAAATTSDADIDRMQGEFPKSCQPALNASIEKVTNEITVMMDMAAARTAELDEISGSTIVMTVVGAAIGLVVILIAGFFAVRAWIARPLNTLAGTMTTLANGNLDVTVAETERRDEVGGMARAVQV
ncbi:HAMP domain-containing protein, partial [Shinella sp. G-2]|uniref:HAMP domain-containing protein n=1 Tax=Shinella sp. G-2 TaxID=3133141 RepID=UPI003D08649A